MSLRKDGSSVEKTTVSIFKRMAKCLSSILLAFHGTRKPRSMSRDRVSPIICFSIAPIENFLNIEIVALNYDMDTKVGPWVVCAEIVSDKGDCPEKFRLTQNAIVSMEAFMEGNIEYYVESPTWRIDCKFQPRPLVFCVFKKADRPMAWKNSNLKIQSTLPLVGNDAIATGALQTPQTYEGKQNPTRLVRVVIRLQR